MKRTMAAVGLAFFLTCLNPSILPAADGEQRKLTEIPAQSLCAALASLAKERQFQLLYRTETVGDLRTQGAHGELTVDEALRQLLKDTQLSYRFIDAKTVKIYPAATTSVPSDGRQVMRLAQAQDTGARVDSGANPPEKVEEVIVTGTTIRGVHPKSSPLEVYSAEDIRRSGATTTEEFIAKLPQNLGRNSPPSATQSGNTATNSIDLRGLGVGTTLVLLNGRRLALSTNGQATDVSQIPVSAIERIEVLTDGASAIYGSDAIGGVVNFVLRDDLQGLETRASYGGVTSGGMSRISAGQSFGTNWTSGNALLSYDFYDATALKTLDRDYAAPAGPGTLTPGAERHNILLTGGQDIGERLELSLDVLGSRRDVDAIRSTATVSQESGNASDELFANVGMDFRWTDSLNASLLASYSAVDTDTEIRQRSLTTGAVTLIRAEADYSATDLTAKLDGKLASLSAGALRFSLGAGMLEEIYESVSAGVPGRDMGRRTDYAFGELFVPLARNLELSVAARYTNLTDTSSPAVNADFGDNFSPKIGLVWAPSEALSLRGTYGESFRAPSLLYIDPVNSANTLTRPTELNGNIVVFNALGSGNPDLQPETLDTYTLGFDLTPPALEDFKLSATWFDISYQEKMGTGDPSNGALTYANPAAFPELFFVPSAAFLEELIRTTRHFGNFSGVSVNFADPAAAAATLTARSDFRLFDNRRRNISSARMNGVDVSMTQVFKKSWGQLSAGLNAAYIADYTQKNTPGSPTQDLLNIVLLPVDLRGRAHGTFTRGALDATLNINYTDGYGNPYAAGGAQAIASWTTLDFNAAYQLAENRGALLSGLKLSLSIENVLDKDPPFVAPSAVSNTGVIAAIGYDPSNANPLGRVIVLGVSKRW